MSLLRDALGAVLVVALATVATPALADHASDHSCSGSAVSRGGSGIADGECGSPGIAARPRECDPESSVIAWYGPVSEDHEYRHVYSGLAIPLPLDHVALAAFNCAGIYVSGPHVLPLTVATDVLAARDRAFAAVTPDFPEFEISPTAAVAGLPTWLWVDQGYWEPHEATQTQGAAQVTVRAVPIEAAWDLDEGDRTCSGPGVPWSRAAAETYDRAPEATRGTGRPACTYTFVHSSTVEADGTYEAVITVYWEFSWSLNGIDQGAFATVGRSSPFDLVVGEVQALITGY